MSELRTRVEELKMENVYQLRLKDMSYNDKIKEMTEKFMQASAAFGVVVVNFHFRPWDNKHP